VQNLKELTLNTISTLLEKGYRFTRADSKKYKISMFHISGATSDRAFSLEINTFLKLNPPGLDYFPE